MRQTPRTNELLRQARQERGWTQRRLADELGVEEQTVSSWERGTRFPSLEFRGRLCVLFSKTPELLGLQLTSRTKEISQEPSLPTTVPVDPTHPLVAKDVVIDGDIIQSVQEGSSGFVLNQGGKNRQRMLERVRFLWITGVLEHSLYHAALIVLGLREQPDAVENPWRLAVQESSLPPRPLPTGTRITQIYDEANGELLILGEPGAGKTTLLLELACDLLLRAEQDGSHPIPVIFNLSSWAVKQPSLAEWLLEELCTKYRVPRKVGQEWIDTNQLLLLLDGLDEVTESARSACVRAINTYQQAYELVPIVVCCRRAEYLAGSTRIALQQAVLVQPLTKEQIDDYLCSAGEQLEAVRKALDEDPELQEMVKTPLMLSIIALTYQGEASAAFVKAGTIEAQRQQVLATYVQRVLSRRGAETRYTQQQTMHWLAWLARQLAQQNQTEFYIERMQPDWLPDEQARQLHRNAAVRLIYGVNSIVIAGLFAWLRGGKQGNVSGVGAGLLGWLGSGPGNTVLGWMAPGLGGGLEGGGMFGLIFGIVMVLVTLLIDASSTPIPAKTEQSWTHLRRNVSQGLVNGFIGSLVVGGLCGLLFFGVSGSLNYAFPRGIGFGLFSGLIVGLLSALVAGRAELDREKSRFISKVRRVRLIDRLIDGLVIGLCGGLSFGIINGLMVGLEQGTIYGVIVGLSFFTAFGFGGGTHLIRGLGTEIKPAETVGWDWQNIRRNLAVTIGKGLMVGISILVVVMIVIGAASTLFYGPAYGAAHGLVYGPIVGLIVGLASILTSILNNGWSSNMLDERQLTRPNEGIRRSMRNGVFAGCLFGPVGGIASGLISGLAFGLIGGLPGWPILGLGFAMIYGIVFAYQAATIRGLIACIEHSILRLRLWRSGIIPLHYVRFLNYATERILLRKVGSGYIFAHRLLLEYFASLDSPSIHTEDVPQMHQFK